MIKRGSACVFLLAAAGTGLTVWSVHGSPQPVEPRPPQGNIVLPAPTEGSLSTTVVQPALTDEASVRLARTSSKPRSRAQRTAVRREQPPAGANGARQGERRTVRHGIPRPLHPGEFGRPLHSS
jgi:hypothetical protein